MNVIAVIPARSGSKGFKHKNIARINGKTLLEHAIRIGLDCPKINDVYVSTDSPEYEQIALDAGAQSLGLRPAYLATDTTKTADVLFDLLKSLHNVYNFIVLLQPTSPVRTSQDIEKMIHVMIEKNASSCVSLSRLNEPHPYKLKIINEHGCVESFFQGSSSEIPRQLLPEVYKLNGALYIVRYDRFMKYRTFFYSDTLPYIMPASMNIDTEQDFILLETLVKNGQIVLL
jgi:CMP-N-acetylneuraminic acid synthetase